MKPLDPPIFPAWRDRVSPLIDTRARDRAVVYQHQRRMVLIAIIILSGFFWAGIFAFLKWAAE